MLLGFTEDPVLCDQSPQLHTLSEGKNRSWKDVCNKRTKQKVQLQSILPTSHNNENEVIIKFKTKVPADYQLL